MKTRNRFTPNHPHKQESLVALYPIQCVCWLRCYAIMYGRTCSKRRDCLLISVYKNSNPFDSIPDTCICWLAQFKLHPSPGPLEIENRIYITSGTLPFLPTAFGSLVGAGTCVLLSPTSPVLQCMGLRVVAYVTSIVELNSTVQWPTKATRFVQTIVSTLHVWDRTHRIQERVGSLMGSLAEEGDGDKESPRRRHSQQERNGRPGETDGRRRRPPPQRRNAYYP